MIYPTDARQRLNELRRHWTKDRGAWREEHGDELLELAYDLTNELEGMRDRSSRMHDRINGVLKTEHDSPSGMKVNASRVRELLEPEKPGDEIRYPRFHRPTMPALCLMRFRDLYVVIDSYGPHDPDKDDWYDFLLHSHQCPTNLMRNAVEIFDAKHGFDLHGMFRFIASIPDNEETRDALDSAFELPALFKLFSTDGTEAPTEWPEKERGLLSWIARMQDAHSRAKAKKG